MLSDMANFANKVRQVLSRRDNGGLEVIAQTNAGVEQAYLVSQDDDLFAVINDALDRAGEGGKVSVENDEYTKSAGKAVSTQLTTSAEDQKIEFNGSRIELSDGSDIDMVELQHDGVTMKDVTLLGNRSNNNIHTCISSTDGLHDIVVENCKVSAAPHGIHLIGLNSSKIIATGTILDKSDADVAIHIDSCNNVIVNTFNARGFTEDGVLVENSSNILSSSVEVNPVTDANAATGYHLKGVTDSRFSGVVAANGKADIGVLDEAYDIGGADEQGSTGNVINVNVVAANDIAYHIKDAEKERVSGLVSGDIEGGGQTTQAFLVEDANGINNPQSVLDIDATNVDRITDTNETGPNVGLNIEGHFSKVGGDSIIGAGGSGKVDVRFGQSVNSPAIRTVSGTSVVAESSPRRASTDNNGQVTIDWSDEYRFADKPIVSATLEQAGQWHVATWNTDADGRYTDAVIQVTDSGGAAVGNNVAVHARLDGS